jgi:bacteriorhodopsin
MVFYTNEPGETMLLKSDWVAVVIAVLGTAVVMYYGWDSRHENPTMKKILYTLLTFVFILLMSCVYLTVADNG